MEAVLLVCIIAHFLKGSASTSVPVVERRGNQLVVPCISAVSHDDLIDLEWLKDGVQIATWMRNVDGNSHMSTNPDEAQHIRVDENDFSLHIMFSKLEHSGTYVCRGMPEKDENGTQVVLFEENTQVIINDIPSRPPGKPIVEVVDEYTLDVEWAYSLQDNNSTITHYILMVRSEYDKSWDKAERVVVKCCGNRTRVRGLQAYTGYEVNVISVNGVGESHPSDASDMVYTLEAAPNVNAKPRFVKAINYTNAIYVEFHPPPKHLLRGALKGYLLTHKKVDSDDRYMQPKFNPNLTFQQLRNSNVTNTCITTYAKRGHLTLCAYTTNETHNFNFTDLVPHTLYLISIQAFNSINEGGALQRAIWTDEGVPSTPRITNLANRTDTLLQVEWERPTFTNGILLGYVIYWSIQDSNATWNQTLYASGDDAVASYVIRGLEPYTSYNLQVAAFTKKGLSEKSDTYPGLTDVRGPGAPVITNLTSNSTHSMRVEWTRPDVVYKQIDSYQVKYREIGSIFYQEMTVHGSDIQKSQQELMMDSLDGTGIRSTTYNQVVISDLQTNTKYIVQVAGATKSIFYYDKYYTGQFSDPVELELKDTSPEHKPNNGQPSEGAVVAVIAGIICTTMLLIVAIILFIFVRRYMKRQYQFIVDRDANKQGPATVITLPETFYEDQNAIPVPEFSKHVTNLHADTDLGFSQEYEEINRNIRTDLTANASTDPDYKHKNRYINIVAYDHSRVLLKAVQGKGKPADYINANFVDGYHKANAYIATQGPLPTTFVDFWHMVWEQNTVVICMITNLTERGRRKCDQYWPNEGEQTYGNISVKLLNTYTMAHYSIRVFTLKNLKIKKGVRQSVMGLGHGSQKGSGERIVYQYHYTDWPDHGVPDFTLPSLMYVRKSAAASTETAGPIIIHCSAGVGRTGTYIMLDTMMRQIKDKNTVSVYNFLSHIRNQRNYLVQTEDQYIFIHDALVEYIQSGGETEIKDSNIAKYIEELQGEVEEGVTLLNKQYALVTEFEPKDFHVNSAMLPINQDKNREGGVVPIELARVRLPAQPGEEGSDYINASFLQGYNKNEEYIVTQHPMKSTIADFWRMVWDKNSMTLVLLSDTDEEDFIEFWPKKDEPMEYGHFSVKFTEETTGDNNVTARDFLLQSTQDDYEYTSRIISTSDWPHSCTTLSTAFELIRLVKTWDQENEEVEGPMVIIDKYGMTEGALFCALSTLHDQLHHEGSVDIYMVAKLYHLKRPGIFSKEDDYLLLYKAIDSICEDTLPAGDRDSGISNCNNYPATLPPPPAQLPTQLTNNSLKNAARAESTM